MKHQATHCAETGADPDDFVDARLFDDMIAQAQGALKTLTPDEVNGWSGKDLDFLVGPFHAVTAYDIAHAGRAAWKARLRRPTAHPDCLDRHGRRSLELHLVAFRIEDVDRRTLTRGPITQP